MLKTQSRSIADCTSEGTLERARESHPFRNHPSVTRVSLYWRAGRGGHADRTVKNGPTVIRFLSRNTRRTCFPIRMPRTSRSLARSCSGAGRRYQIGLDDVVGRLVSHDFQTSDRLYPPHCLHSHSVDTTRVSAHSAVSWRPVVIAEIAGGGRSLRELDDVREGPCGPV